MQEIQPDIREAYIPDVKPLVRGVWAERLVNNQELPVGGSLFNDELTLKLKLDFDSFAEEIKTFTKEAIQTAFESAKPAITEWLQKMNSDIDPYLFFVAQQVQQKMQQLLDAGKQTHDEQSPTREQAYRTDESPKLSELKGRSKCSEQAALGQYLLQQLEIPSAYVGGITMANAKDNDEYAEEHSYLSVYSPDRREKTYIFDIARPHSQRNLARVLEPVVPFNYDLLKGKNELLVKSCDVLTGDEIWFGAGHATMGEHNIIEQAPITQV